MQDSGNKRTLSVRWDECIFCGQCQLNCPTAQGIMLSAEFDLATTEQRDQLIQKIEKELVLCECCQEVIAPRDQIIWVAKKLGTLIFTNASLMRFYLQNFQSSHAACGLPCLPAGRQPAAKPTLKPESEFLRSDRIKLTCPRCRREAVVKS
jgi:hydrogenase-4 component H